MFVSFISLLAKPSLRRDLRRSRHRAPKVPVFQESAHEGSIKGGLGAKPKLKMATNGFRRARVATKIQFGVFFAQHSLAEKKTDTGGGRVAYVRRIGEVSFKCRSSVVQVSFCVVLCRSASRRTLKSGVARPASGRGTLESEV